MIVQQGQINTTALWVPDIYVQIIPPQLLLNGVPSNIVGIVGTATWGPVNAPTIVGDYASYVAQFGQMQPQTYDMGTALYCAALQNAMVFNCVRVTDGTDVAASVAIGSTGVTVTAKYTGTLGNSLNVVIATGSAANSWRVAITLPGAIPEVFDNLAAGLTGNAVWLAIAAALNNGISGLRGPSQYVVATAGSATAAPSAATSSLASGTDGATTITSAVLVGVDTVPRKGMYALRNTGTSIAMLADASDSTQWTLQVAYGLSEGTYMLLVGPAGDTISNAVTAKGTAGIDSYAAKLIFGDWCYIDDNVNNVQRLVSPQGFVAGVLGALSPEQSSMNKPIWGIIGTQKTIQNTVYSYAELQTLGQAGLDLVTNPAPGGNYFAVRFGRNSSSNAVLHWDSYTRMTNYLAQTLNAGMGKYNGLLQSATVRAQALATVTYFLQALWDQGMIGNAEGTIPYAVQCDIRNNPPTRVALGYMQIDVKVQYLAVIDYLIINLEGGSVVQIQNGFGTPLQAAA